jgi:hypothetical protein
MLLSRFCRRVASEKSSSPYLDRLGLFDVARAKLAASTVKAQKQCLRLAASALVGSGIHPQSIVGLRHLCTPAAFRGAIEQIVDIRGGVYSTVENVAHVLRKVATLSGVLSPEEVKEVEEAHKRLRCHFKRRAFPRKERDQAMLDRFDNDGVTDSFLTLATRTVDATRKSGKPTRQAALLVQRALALELSIWAPIRLKNLVALNIDKHFHVMTVEGVERTLLCIPGEEIKNGEPAEHFLSEDATSLLHLYLKRYRSRIAKNPGPWLFPGAGGGHKTENTMGTQLSKWVREELGIDYHPHLIRKIMPKLYLDIDPGGLEVVRRQLGHKSNEMLYGVYLQRVSRASQKKYADTLEGRKLTALGLVKIDVDRRGGS